MKRESLTLSFQKKTDTKTSRCVDFLDSFSSNRHHNLAPVPNSFCKWSSSLSVLAPYRDQPHQSNLVTPKVKLCSCLNSAWLITTWQCGAGSKERLYFHPKSGGNWHRWYLISRHSFAYHELFRDTFSLSLQALSLWGTHQSCNFSLIMDFNIGFDAIFFKSRYFYLCKDSILLRIKNYKLLHCH
jgi:hypothetical protein